MGMLLRVTLRILKWHPLCVDILAVMPKRLIPAGSSLGGNHIASGNAFQLWRGWQWRLCRPTASVEAPLGPR